MAEADRVFRIALVTAPDLRTARRLAKAALQARLAACVNLLPGVQSHYWWKSKIESSPEVLLLFKTRHSQLPKLEKLILAEHPYDTPEFIVLPILRGNRRYLAWINESLASAPPRYKPRISRLTRMGTYPGNR